MIVTIRSKNPDDIVIATQSIELHDIPSWVEDWLRVLIMKSSSYGDVPEFTIEVKG